MEQFLKKLFKDAGKDDDLDNKKPIKSIPMKKEWIALDNEADALAERLVSDLQRFKAIRSKLWADIELESGEFGTKRINSKTKEIEIFEDDK